MGHLRPLVLSAGHDGTLEADKPSADEATGINCSKINFHMLLAGMISADKAPDIQGDERELLKFPIIRIVSDQRGTSEICDLLETIANLWPELREAIDEATQLLNQETAGVNDSVLPVEPQTGKSAKRRQRQAKSTDIRRAAAEHNV